MKETRSATMGHDRDAETIRAIREGDQERYRELIERYERMVFSLAWARLGDVDLAEEAAQETFIKAYRHLDFLRNGNCFAAWITAMTRNVAINLGLRNRHELAKRQRWALEVADRTQEEPRQEKVPVQTLRQSLSALPAHHREALALFYFEEKSVAECSAQLGIAEGAFKTRLHRARSALRETLEQRLEEALKEMRPSNPIAPAVMVLLATPAGEAAAVTSLGLLAKLACGKLLPFSWCLAGLWIATVIPGVLLGLWLARSEARNYRDSEGFRAKIFQSMVRRALIVFPALFTAFLLLRFVAGPELGLNIRHLAGMAGIFFLIWGAMYAHWLKINRVMLGQTAAVLILGSSYIWIGFGGMATIAFTLVNGLVLACLAFSIGSLPPMRMDYSLFLRQAQGMTHPRGETFTAGANVGLSRRELFAFARFLGERWLALDYRCLRQDLRLRLPAVKPSTLIPFFPMIWGRASVLTLRPDGGVNLSLSARDHRQLMFFASAPASREELENQVSIQVQAAWGAFRSSRIHEAEQLLGEQSEETIFHVPPSKHSRTNQAVLLLAALLIIALGTFSWFNQRSREANRFPPVAATEAEVRDALARLAADQVEEPEAWGRIGDGLPVLSLTVPPKGLFTDAAWQNVTRVLFENFSAILPAGEGEGAFLNFILGWPLLQKAVVSGFFSSSDLIEMGLTPQSVDAHMATHSPAHLKLTTQFPQPSPTDQPGFHLESISWRLQTLHQFDCLNWVDPGPIVEQVRLLQVLPGREFRGSMANPKLLRGLFGHGASEPLRMTYHALMILSLLAGLDEIDRQACIQGILRFHRGRGIFLSPEQEPVFINQSHAAFFAFESLRLLDGLDQVRDLERWAFRPNASSAHEQSGRILHATEIEAWLFQERLSNFLETRRLNPAQPAPSLLTGTR